MELSHIIFFFFAGLSLLGAGVILLTRNVLYAAFALMLCFLGLAGLYVYADFVAATQIMVYVGGILILIVFGVMLTNRGGDARVLSGKQRTWTGSLLAVILFVAFFRALWSQPWSETTWLAAASGQETSLRDLGYLLMTDYVLAFEMAGILLLIALIAAAYLARESAQPNREEEQA